MDTSPLIDRRASPSLATLRRTDTATWKPAAIASDVATLGAGTLLAGVVNAALVFVIPKLLSVEDYGYWRLFALYASYVGFLHFGFADGALLRWAGRPWDEFRKEVGTAAKYLLWQHIVVLVPLSAIAIFLLPGRLRFVVIAVAVCALLVNESRLLQFGLEGARVFRPVAVSTVLPPALLLALVLLWCPIWQSSNEEVIIFYAIGWALALAFLFLRTRAWGKVSGVEWTCLAKSCVLMGWSIMMANTGVLLIAGADRLAVSWAVPIQEFAQYSLAASVIAVPVLAIQACSKVFFSHLAAVTQEQRRRVYGVSSQILLIAWALLLPYYSVLDVFIRACMPKYVPSLQYARVLLLGIPFLAVIQILHMSYAYLQGTQKRFLAETTAVLVISLALTSFAAFHTASLIVVAEVQVAILGAWWSFNEWTIRALSGQDLRGWAKVVAIFGGTAVIYWIATSWRAKYYVSVPIYYACVIALIAAICCRDLRLWCRTLVGRDGSSAGTGL